MCYFCFVNHFNSFLPLFASRTCICRMAIFYVFSINNLFYNLSQLLLVGQVKLVF